MAPSRRQGPVVVTVTFYGQSMASDKELSVEYIQALRVLSSSPVLGPAKGGTAVTILGEGFHAEEAYMCAFGLSQPIVEATFMNYTAIMCHTPPVVGSQHIGEAGLRVWAVQDGDIASGSSNGYGFAS
ncbi:unnamed protein product, partial [Scytosiphon promiscuus]